MPLTSLAKQVEDFASFCLPDYVFTSDEQDLRFIETDIGDLVGADHPINIAAMTLRAASLGVGDRPFAFTRWSRSQLLSLLGTREKWFNTVSRAQEVEELNIRLHVLRRYTIRSMRSFDSPDLCLVRGVVSEEYADLPDTVIMESLLKLLPNGYAVRYYSGKSDRAFYAYTVTGDNQIGIPGTSFQGFPGVVIKNSEVGYTSLWVIPMLFIPNYGVPLVLKRHAVLRRIHRGEVAQLADKFAEALEKTKALWGPMEERLARLRSINYPDEDAAVEAIARMLVSAGARRFFIHNCELAYRGARHVVHDGFGVFEAVLSVVQGEGNKDTAYDAAELAGAVLLQLLK